MFRVFRILSVLVGLSVSLSIAAPPSLRPPRPSVDPSERQRQMIDFLGKIVPDEESIGYVAKIDLRTMRPGLPPAEMPAGRLDRYGEPLPTGARARARATTGYGLFHLAFAPNGGTVIAGRTSCMGTTVGRWDADTGRPLGSFYEDRGSLWALAVAPDGKTVATAGGFAFGNKERSSIQVWDLERGIERGAFGLGTRAAALVFTHDGKRVISAGENGDIWQWELPAGEKRRLIARAGGSLTAVALSPDGGLVAVAHEDGEVSFWQAGSGKLLRRVGTSGKLGRLEFSRDGRLLVVGNQIWDVAAGKPLRQFRDGVPGSSHLALSPDGRTVAAVGEKGVFLWEVATGKQRRTMERPDSGNWYAGVAFAPHGRTLVTGGRDTLIWDATGRSEEGTLPEATFTPRGLDELWADLADEPERAHAALWALVATPRQSVPFLGALLRPTPPIDEQRIQRWIVDLDSEQFAVRQKATDELEKTGERAVPALRRRLETKPPLETRQRIERLLDTLEPIAPPRDTLLALRAMEVLEYVGNPDAMDVLKRLATGAPGARLTLEAQSALTRLGK
ncbi:MAG: hypothetical protein K2R98_12565 [Gemmataceae bacterium]|nr:hypothetical protein [Gemmataceae bacterium]